MSAVAAAVAGTDPIHELSPSNVPDSRLSEVNKKQEGERNHLPIQRQQCINQVQTTRMGRREAQSAPLRTGRSPG